jgi:hypothetical protein
MKYKIILIAALISVCATTLAKAPGNSTRKASAPTKAMQVVKVIGTDYAFEVPDAVTAGRTEILFQNDGKQKHEIAVVLARPGTTSAQISAAAASGIAAPRLAEAYSDGSPLGALFAAPGTTSRATMMVNLQHGQTYVFVCTLRDTPAMPQHASMGMYHLFQVK